MDNVLQQLGIDCIFSASYNPLSNGKLGVFHKYFKPTLKKWCKRDPDNWHKYINQILASYQVTPYLATAETHFFLLYRRDPILSLHQLLEPMEWFLGDQDSGHLELKSYHLPLAIAKKILDENRFKYAQKTTICNRPIENKIFSLHIPIMTKKVLVPLVGMKPDASHFLGKHPNH